MHCVANHMFDEFTLAFAVQNRRMLGTLAGDLVPGWLAAITGRGALAGFKATGVNPLLFDWINSVGTAGTIVRPMLSANA